MVAFQLVAVFFLDKVTNDQQITKTKINWEVIWKNTKTITVYRVHYKLLKAIRKKKIF